MQTFVPTQTAYQLFLASSKLGKKQCEATLKTEHRLYSPPSLELSIDDSYDELPGGMCEIGGSDLQDDSPLVLAVDVVVSCPEVGLQ